MGQVGPAALRKYQHSARGGYDMPPEEQSLLAGKLDSMIKLDVAIFLKENKEDIDKKA